MHQIAEEKKTFKLLQVVLGPANRGRSFQSGDTNHNFKTLITMLFIIKRYSSVNEINLKKFMSLKCHPDANDVGL